MHPVLIKLGPVTIHTYGFLFALGVLMGILLSLRLAKREKIETKKMADMLFYVVLIALVGAKLFLFFTEFGYYLKNPGQIKYLITSGGTFYGGLIFALLFAIWYMKKNGMNARVIGDVAAPGIALGHFFGRLGCFAAGCCFGRPALDFPLGIKFTSQYAHTHTGVPLNTALYPTQLFEAGLNLLNFIILMTVFYRKKFNGQVILLYLFNYSLIRFVIEYFRGDGDRGYIFGGPANPFTSLSVPQLISLIGIIISIVLYRRFKKRGADETV
jgi:phosphatidylglycerol:prolipoprotein diacylglycerol transferase